MSALLTSGALSDPVLIDTVAQHDCSGFGLSFKSPPMCIIYLSFVHRMRVELQPPTLHIQDPPNAQIALVQSLHYSPIANSMVIASSSSVHCIQHSQSATMKNFTHIYMYLKVCFDLPAPMCVLFVSFVLHYQSHHLRNPVYIHR